MLRSEEDEHIFFNCKVFVKGFLNHLQHSSIVDCVDLSDVNRLKGIPESIVNYLINYRNKLIKKKNSGKLNRLNNKETEQPNYNNE